MVLQEQAAALLCADGPAVSAERLRSSQAWAYCRCTRTQWSDSSSLRPARTCRIGEVSVSRPEVSMRKVLEIIMVIVAAGLAAAVALIDIPTHSAAPGTVVSGGGLLAAPPSTSAPTLPPLPPLLFPPGSSTPIPIESPATPAPTLPLRAQPPQGVTKASSPAMGMLGTSLAQHAPTPTTEPPSATKPKPPPTSKKPNPPPATKPKPPPASSQPKPPPDTKKKPKSETKPEDSRKATSAGPSPRSSGGGADEI